MKQKLFTLLLAVAASLGTMFSSVTVDGIAYNLNETELTAEVTSGYNYSGKITIPESVSYNSISYSVTSIGNYAFYGCKGLTSIEIPNSVTSIGNSAFSYCSGLTSIVWNAKNCNGYNFGSQVTSYIFGNEVEVIPSGICSGMTNLTSVTIPNSVTSIGDNAFNSCSGLTSVTIPNSVTSIGNNAFSYCSGLTSIEIPNSVTSIGNSAFSYCSGLTSIVWNAKNCNGYNFGSQVTSYIFGNEVEVIPSGICSGMTNLTSVTIPNNVTNIGGSAFAGCSGLTSVIMGNNVASIGDNAFSSCSGLTSVTIPNKVTSLADGVFSGCKGLTSIEIPNSVTSIGDYAFSGCSGLTSIEIPNSVTSIGDFAFSGCSGLTSVTIPNSVTSIGDRAFRDCIGLTSIVIPNSVQNCTWRAYHEKLINVESPSWFFDVAEKNWSECPKYLKSVIINDGEINDNGFSVISRSYKTLTNLDIAKATNTNIADEAFKGFYNLQSLALPANLTKVSYMSVAECVKLQSIDIPASIIEIEDRAFENCRSLKSITFGGQAASLPGLRNSLVATSQLQSIGNWAFYNCHELQNLEIPEGVTFIGDGAFYGCVYLEDLTLPSSTQTIGDNTFALCAKLQKIVVNAPVPPSIQAKTFYDVKRQIPVYVPDESIDAYKNDAQWSEFDIQGVSKQPTAIDQVESSSLQTGTKGRLILRNGQIFILNGNKTFTLTGQEVK